MSLLLYVAAVATQQWTSVVRDPERPLTLREAQRMHRDGMRYAEQKAAEGGHYFSNTEYGTERARRAVDAFSPGHAISPLDYGGDPSGVKDSTAAVQRALQALLALPNGTMAEGIRDMGGAVLDLRGGRFLISAAVKIPKFYGNLRMKGGTLKASPTFPSTDYLVMVGGDDCVAGGQGCCNEEISFVDMMFDASHSALGGLYVTHTMGTVVSASFFTGFKGYGVHVTKGHELMVAYSWFAEYYWSQHHPQTDSVGIRLDGDDNYITNVIVFDYAHTGVIVNGSSNVLAGVHTWNGGGVGIQLGTPTSTSGGHTSRLIGCYCDYNSLRLYNPYIVVVTDTYFLHTKMEFMGHGARSLRFTQNSFSSTPETVVLEGNFTQSSVGDVVITGLATKVTTASKTVTLKAGQQSIDFGDVLVFPWIRTVRYSVVGDNVQTVRAVTVSGTSVVVTAAESGETITVDVEN